MVAGECGLNGPIVRGFVVEERNPDIGSVTAQCPRTVDKRALGTGSKLQVAITTNVLVR